MKFERGFMVADKLPEETEMVGEAMPLLTVEDNTHIKDFLDKNGHHLKKELLDKVLCGH
jgi:hypothetical protein|tara:strand:+ start:81 stop:257 length:177 start_codon:yes stop_codon:yes gene_type:complete